MALTAAEIEQLAISAATRAAKAEVEEAAEKAANAAAEKVSLNHEEITKLVAEAVRQTLLQMVVDSSDPIAMQLDFQHLRAWRESWEEIKKKGLMVLTGIFVTGIFSPVDIAYAAIYNRVLSDAEIADAYLDIKAYLSGYRGLLIS